MIDINIDDKLIELFELVHGKVECPFYLELRTEDRPLTECAVVVMQDGKECWEATCFELVFSLLCSGKVI
jgi:hypothetical protein